MYRTVPYIVLFLILALLQIFLFDNLSISIYLCPLVYIGFIVLLPSASSDGENRPGSVTAARRAPHSAGQSAS